jgi:hypothetical protein
VRILQLYCWQADGCSRLVEQLTEAIEARNQYLGKLLPLLDFDNLPDVRREDIIQLITGSHEGNDSLNTGDTLLDRESLSTAGYEFDEGEHEWDEPVRQQDCTSPVADDVNGLAVSRENGSYLGTSSISLALRSIFALCPDAKQAFLQLSNNLSSSAARNDESVADILHQLPSAISPAAFSPSAPQEQLFIDAYFDHIHPMLPMVDEAWFRNEFSASSRTDDAWIALLNMILAFGSIAGGDDHSHGIYYGHVQKVVGHNVFASGHLEMLQALILLGGSYLHYINSPNTAYLIMGTAFRMAIAMALHRDPAGVPSSRRHRSVSAASALAAGYSLSRAETRRRTWWCLICTDAWNGILLGRPSTTRWDPLTMDTDLPTAGNGQQDANEAEAQLMTDSDWTATSLRLSSQFCKISSRIEYRLSQMSRLSAREVLAFDGQLQTWDKARPPAFKAGISCPRRIRHIRDTVYHRYQICRIVMSRPFLLKLTQDPASCLRFTDEDWRVVSICRDAASQIINDIGTNQLRTRIFVWHASWYLFQACMVRLLSIAMDGRLPPEMRLGDMAISGYREEIGRAICTFKDMSPWARSTDKYGEVIEALNAGVVLAMNSKSLPETIQSDTHIFGNPEAGNLGSPFLFDDRALDIFDTFPDWFDYDLVFGEGLGQP